MPIMRDENTAEAVAEDLEYGTVDLLLPVEQRCSDVHKIVMYGADCGTRTCSRRAEHVNDRHRDGEISWKVQ